MPGEPPQPSPFAQRAQQVAPVQQPVSRPVPLPTAGPAPRSGNTDASSWATGSAATEWRAKIDAAVRVEDLKGIVSQLQSIRSGFEAQIAESSNAEQVDQRGKDEEADGTQQNPGPLRGPQGGDAV